MTVEVPRRRFRATRATQQICVDNLDSTLATADCPHAATLAPEFCATDPRLRDLRGQAPAGFESLLPRHADTGLDAS
jgi:hypothetical protein